MGVTCPELPNIQDSGWKLSGRDIEYECTKVNLIIPEQLVKMLCDQNVDVDDNQQNESNVDEGVEMTNM